MSTNLTPQQAADVVAEIAKASKIWEAVLSGQRALEALRTAEAALRGQDAERDDLRGNLAEAQAWMMRAAKLVRHAPNCLWLTPLPTGVGCWGCSCGADGLVLDGDPLVQPTFLDASIAEAVAAYKADAERMTFLDQPGIELAIDHDPEADGHIVVYQSRGGRNDLEWAELGRGGSVRAAIDAARGAKS